MILNETLSALINLRYKLFSAPGPYQTHMPKVLFATTNSSMHVYALGFHIERGGSFIKKETENIMHSNRALKIAMA